MHCSLSLFWGMLIISSHQCSLEHGDSSSLSLLYFDLSQSQNIKYAAEGSCPGKAEGISYQ